jgi:hypothetical protein
MDVLNSEPILFFDGVCNLCNGFIDWLVRRDKHARIKIASLQGNTAQRVIPELSASLDTIILVDGAEIMIKSDAVLKSLAMLPGIWPTVSKIGFLFPKGFRDGVYKLTARNRYRLFGKKDSCRLPTASERGHFLP